MRLSLLSALALSAQTSLAYLNTSPFFLFSTSSRFDSRPTSQLDTSSKVIQDISEILHSCPTKYYVFVSQAGVSTSDYVNSKNTPELASRLQSTHSDTKSSIVVSEVLGGISTQKWKAILEDKCKAKHLIIESNKAIPRQSSPAVLEMTLPELSKTSKSTDLKANDAQLAKLLGSLPEKDYTIVYTTSISGASASVISDTETGTQYEMENPFFDIPHAELKRDLSFHKRQANSNETLVDGPLFDRYQFFTPGIWMGLVTSLLLLSILYVGVNALASLQVTYAAFEKESGPQSSKKAQ